MSITVLGRARAKPAREKQVKEELLNLTALTQTEPGCIQFESHQATDDKTQFLTYGTWESQRAFESHRRQPYVTNLLDRADELFDGPIEITLWEMIAAGG